MDSYPALKIFEANELGRDFVIGDLHGNLELLCLAMEHVGFDSARDRLFSVGDLIDRGPDSLASLGLLREPWFHAVRANHEDLMQRSLAGTDFSWFINGGMWGLPILQSLKNDQPTDETRELLGLAAISDTLPYLITVKLRNGERAHLIHAELPERGVGLTDADLEDEQFVAYMASVQDGNGSYMLWARDIFYPFYRSDFSNRKAVLRTAKYHGIGGVPALSRVISGHSVVHNPLTLFNFTNIDTGAFDHHRKQWAGLTLLELNEWRFYKARPDGVSEVQPIVVNSFDELVKDDT